MASASASAFIGFAEGFEMNPKKTASHTRPDFRSESPNYRLYEQLKREIWALNLPAAEYARRLRVAAERAGV